MLNIGLIGLGPDWETLYAPALRQLSRRVRVTAVYDAVASRAVQAADQLRAWPVGGVRALLCRHDVKAVLVLDAGWQGLAPLEFAIEHERPAFVSAPFDAGLGELEQLHASASAAGLLLMPALPLRSTPAAARLRELTATQLGAVRRVTVMVAGNAAFDNALCGAVIDWCAQVVQASRFKIGPTHADAGHAAKIAIELQRSGPDRPPVVLEILCSEPAARRGHGVPEQESAPFEAVIECEAGHAELLGPDRLRWRSDAHEAEEHLSRERPATEIIIDYFARRVVGGLIPVPDLGDVLRALRPLHDERQRPLHG